jgi:hypothetical protein
MTRIAASMSVVFRSGSLRSAIARSCAVLIDPAPSCPGRADPLPPNAFLMRNAVGGDLSRSSNERSSYTVTTTGTTSPRCPAVLAS